MTAAGIFAVIAERHAAEVALLRAGLGTAAFATACRGNAEQSLRDFHVMRFHRRVVNHSLQARGAA